jgi:Putative peptidoglycan binding domain
MELAANIRSRNVPDRMAARDTGGSLLQISTNARAGRIVLKMAVMAAIFLGGYLAGRFTILEDAPTSPANTRQAQAEPPALEPSAPSVWASQASMIHEASPALPPVSEPTAPKPAGKPVGDTRPLSSDEVLETQAWLKAFGFDPGPLDGVPGSKTTEAVKRYRTSRQMEETGALDRSVLQQVRQQSGQLGR